MFGYCTAQLFVLTLGMALLLFGFDLLFRQPEQTRSVFQAAGISAAGLLALVLVFGVWRWTSPRGCFACGKKATTSSSLGAFRVNFCGEDCAQRARNFWKGMWDGAIQNTAVFGPKMLELLKADAVAEVKSSIFKFDGEGIAAASLSEVKLRKDFGYTREQEKRNIWEAARQLHLRGVVLLRKGEVHLQAARKE